MPINKNGDFLEGYGEGFKHGFEIGFEDGFKEAQGRIKELEAQIEELHCGVTAAHFQGYIEGVQAAEAKLTGGKDE